MPIESFRCTWHDIRAVEADFSLKMMDDFIEGQFDPRLFSRKDVIGRDDLSANEKEAVKKATADGRTSYIGMVDGRRYFQIGLPSSVFLETK